MIEPVERIVAAGVAVLLAAVAVWRARRTVRDGGQPVEPLVLFLSVWAFALALFAVPWIQYTQTSTRTWIAVYGSILTFSLGCLAVYRLSPARGPSPGTPPGGAETIAVSRLRLVWAGALVLGLIGFAAYVRAVIEVLGLQTALHNPSLVRDIQTTSPEFDSLYGRWRLLIYFNQISLLVWTIGLRSGAFGGRWRLAAPLGLLAAAPFLFTGERTLLATGVVWIVFFHLVWRPIKSWRRALAAAVTVAVVLAVGFLVIGSRQQKTIDAHPEITAALTTQTFSGAAIEFLYVTGNVPTLSQLMRAPEAPQTHGQMTLLPGVKLVHALTGLGGEPPEEVGAFYAIPFETFNNYSWLGTFYLDFGLLGCLLLPALFGAAAAGIAVWARRRGTLLSAWTLSLVLYVTAFTPLLNKLSTTLTWQYLLLAPFVVPLLLEGGWPARRRAWPAGLSAALTRARVGLATAALLLVLAVTTLGADNPPRATRAADLERRLLDAAQRIHVIYDERGSLPADFALASQLHVADPAARFTKLGGYVERPPQDTIGVYSGPSDTWLWGALPDGTGRALHIVLKGRRSGTRLQTLRVRNLLRDGDLERRLGDPWMVRAAPNAVIRIDSDMSWASDSSLRVGGRRRLARAGARVSQTVRRLPRRSAGSVYTLRLQSYAPRLSRPLRAAMKFTYRDGSVRLFRARPGTTGSAGEPSRSAISPTDTGGWNVATAVGVARKPLMSIQVRLLDTGTLPLSGRAWIDGVSLVSGDSAVRFPRPR